MTTVQWKPYTLPSQSFTPLGLLLTRASKKADAVQFRGRHSSEPIRFFSKSDPPYNRFSNFAHYPFQLDGKEWPTVEQYFQAQKFATTDPDWAEAIRRSDPNDPKQSKKMGRSRDHAMRSDWNAVKDDVMRKAVRAKFTNPQYPELQKTLMGTGNRPLIEDTDDPYWGRGGPDNPGQNRLGIILMELRTTLKAETPWYQHIVETIFRV